MKIKISGNKYLDGIFLLMLFSASVHMALLFFWALTGNNWHLLNYFGILEIGGYFPRDMDFLQNDFASWIIAAALYAVILKLNNENG